MVLSELNKSAFLKVEESVFVGGRGSNGWSGGKAHKRGVLWSQKIVRYC